MILRYLSLLHGSRTIRPFAAPYRECFSVYMYMWERVLVVSRAFLLRLIFKFYSLKELSYVSVHGKRSFHYRSVCTCPRYRTWEHHRSRSPETKNQGRLDKIHPSKFTERRSKICPRVVDCFIRFFSAFLLSLCSKKRTSQVLSYDCTCKSRRKKLKRVWSVTEPTFLNDNEF